MSPLPARENACINAHSTRERALKYCVSDNHSTWRVQQYIHLELVSASHRHNAYTANAATRKRRQCSQGSYCVFAGIESCECGGGWKRSKGRSMCWHICSLLARCFPATLPASAANEAVNHKRRRKYRVYECAPQCGTGHSLISRVCCACLGYMSRGDSRALQQIVQVSRNMQLSRQSRRHQLYPAIGIYLSIPNALRDFALILEAERSGLDRCRTDREVEVVVPLYEYDLR